MARETNYIGIAIILFGVLIVALLGIQTMCRVPEEPFVTSGTSKAVTRADSCSCLPGYIPAKLKATGTYVCQKLGEPQTTRACY